MYKRQVVDDAIVVVEAVQARFDVGYKSSYMARKAAKQLMQRTGADPDDIDLVRCV